MREFFYQVGKENRNLFYKLYIHEIGPFRFNWHKEIEINIILKGKVEVCVEGRKYLLEEDDCIIINSNSGHATLSKEPNSIAMVFHIDPICFKEYFKEYESLRFDGIIIDSSENNVKYKIIRYLLASLLYELKKDTLESKITSDAIFSLAIANMVKVFPPTRESSDKAKNYKNQMEIISKLLNYIEDKYKDKITLEKIADKFGYNSSYVSHFFKVNIGINFHDYLTRVRIREATFELAKTDHSISDIAINHGFSDIKSFNKSFKESFGRAPNQYRSEIQGSNSSKYFSSKRVFVYEDNEDVNCKLYEYRKLLKDNPLLMDIMDFKVEDTLQQEQSYVKYKNRIRELERELEELNKKMELIRSILQ